jgi:hypothetical protein
MVAKFVSKLQQPFRTYLDLTITEPCKSLIESSKKNTPRRTRKNTNSFSIRRHIQKQREMTSPEVQGHSVDNTNLRHKYIKDLQAAPVSSDWVH